MGRVVLVLSLLAAGVAAGILVPGSARGQTSMLVGDVGAGDAFVISLTDVQGARVTHLDPGTYTLLVHDRSAIHDFHLVGPGVDVTTSVDGTGDSTFEITVSDGAYTYICDPHASRMRGTFTVGTVTTTTTTTTTPTTTRRVRLRGSVGPGRSISLAPRTGLSAGPATIVVRDRAATENFRLTGPGIAKATGVPFRGTVTWKVMLRAGRYVYRSDRTRSLRGTFRVSAPAP